MPLEYLPCSSDAQFTCQHPGCSTIFAINPGSLDRYLSHIEQWRKEESEARVPLRQRHSYETNEKAVTIKPNPYYKPPGPQDEVPPTGGPSHRPTCLPP